MSFDLCKTCGKHTWQLFGIHKCPPCWEVWRSDEPKEEARKVYANDSEDAVEQWAEKVDEDGDPSIANGCKESVYVALVGSEELKLYDVRGEYQPVYSAYEVEE